MNWQNVPIGMLRYDELLNSLLAIWKTQHNLITNHTNNDKFSQGYRLGFEEGLDAIAQVAGLSDAFEDGKATHRARLKAKLDARVDVIDSPVLLVDGD